jgi:hypothetical protein
MFSPSLPVPVKQEMSDKRIDHEIDEECEKNGIEAKICKHFTKWRDQVMDEKRKEQYLDGDVIYKATSRAQSCARNHHNQH